MNYFDKYTKSYDLKIKELSYKYYHSYRVMDNMLLLAKSMNLSSKDMELAKCIGLLHDIGRFHQFELFRSFSDKNIDHATYGEELLRKENALRYFPIDEVDHEVVYIAIRNHNKYQIENNLPKRTLLFTKMIRDADKLDIIYAIGNPELKSIVKEDDSSISRRVSSEFYQDIPIKKNYAETLNEKILILLSFAYDLNFKITLNMIKTNNYFEKIYARLENKELFLPYIKHIEIYINERAD